MKKDKRVKKRDNISNEGTEPSALRRSLVLVQWTGQSPREFRDPQQWDLYRKPTCSFTLVSRRGSPKCFRQWPSLGRQSLTPLFLSWVPIKSQERRSKTTVTCTPVLTPNWEGKTSYRCRCWKFILEFKSRNIFLIKEYELFSRVIQVEYWLWKQMVGF